MFAAGVSEGIGLRRFPGILRQLHVVVRADQSLVHNGVAALAQSQLEVLDLRARLHAAERQAQLAKCFSLREALEPQLDDPGGLLEVPRTQLRTSPAKHSLERASGKEVTDAAHAGLLKSASAPPRGLRSCLSTGRAIDVKGVFLSFDSNQIAVHEDEHGVAEDDRVGARSTRQGGGPERLIGRCRTRCA